MPGNLNVIVRSWIRLLEETIFWAVDERISNQLVNGVHEEKAMKSVKSVENKCFKRTSFRKEKCKIQIRKLNKNAFLGRMEKTPR
jgi:hypothetical protein